MPDTLAELYAHALTAHKTGRLEEAVAGYRHVLAQDPDHANALHLLSQVLLQCQQPAEALTQVYRALQRHPAVAPFHYTAALILRQLHRPSESVWHLLSAILLSPEDPAPYLLLGNLHFLAERFSAAELCFRQLLTLDPQHADAANNLGNTLERLQQPDEAVPCLQRAAQLQPAAPTVATNLSKLLARLVPSWHPPMMNDSARNRAYAAALARAVRPGMLVLEIGTGAGLLALMAARAGAERVITCEMQPTIAEAARAVIAANGLTERITVLTLNSAQLRIGHELPRPADVLVSEILSNELLNEGVLPALEDARARLLAPGAAIIPVIGALRAVLAGGDYIAANVCVEQVEGFDVSPFNQVCNRRVGLDLRWRGYESFCTDFEPFRFDFTASNPTPEGRTTLHLPVTRSGRCYGVLQWIWLGLDDATHFENHPATPVLASGWQHMLYRFETPVELRAGQTVTLVATHNRFTPWFHLERVTDARP